MNEEDFKWTWWDEIVSVGGVVLTYLAGALALCVLLIMVAVTAAVAERAHDWVKQEIDVRECIAWRYE